MRDKLFKKVVEELAKGEEVLKFESKTAEVEYPRRLISGKEEGFEECLKFLRKMGVK
jgi:hypothetical protein